MTRERKDLGDWGERVAKTHLEAKGYTIVESNWRCALGEIDIIASENEQLVFVEVKTRRGKETGLPEEALTERKANKLLELASQYVNTNALQSDWRIDFVAVELDEDGLLLRCEHIPNAVLGW